VKVAQELARHSTPTLTIGRYSHTRLHDVSAALDSLPDLDATKPDNEPATLAATGTDGRATYGDVRCHLNRTLLGGELGRNTATDGERWRNRQRADESPKLLACAELATKKPPLASGGEDTPTGSRTPVFGLRTRRPGPLDDGGVAAIDRLFVFPLVCLSANFSFLVSCYASWGTRI
jgi:hypothetical protein